MNGMNKVESQFVVREASAKEVVVRRWSHGMQGFFGRVLLSEIE